MLKQEAEINLEKRVYATRTWNSDNIFFIYFGVIIF